MTCFRRTHETVKSGATPMIPLRNVLAILFLCSLGLSMYLLVHKTALPHASLIDRAVTTGEPRQDSSRQPPFTATIKGYTYVLMPRASYDISGLVVSQHRGDALLNIYHKQDPGNTKDVCVVWGDNITNGSYLKMEYSSEEFSCYYTWSSVVTPPFSPERMSNTHLIPASDLIAEQIARIHIGDQIRMKGLLVDYRVADKHGHTIFTRRTSLTRTDTGNGACEILYVTELGVLQAGSHLPADARAYAWYATLGLLLSLGVVWLIRLNREASALMSP
jgi:hypothetical protein